MVMVDLSIEWGLPIWGNGMTIFSPMSFPCDTMLTNILAIILIASIVSNDSNSSQNGVKPKGNSSGNGRSALTWPL